MKKVQSLAGQWKTIKTLFSTETNGNEDDPGNYGKNFMAGGKLDRLTQSLLMQLGSLTCKYGHSAVVEGKKLDTWKVHVWKIIEEAGLLEPLTNKRKKYVKKIG